jgi:hypothetical protein
MSSAWHDIQDEDDDEEDDGHVEVGFPYFPRLRNPVPYHDSTRTRFSSLHPSFEGAKIANATRPTTTKCA